MNKKQLRREKYNFNSLLLKYRKQLAKLSRLQKKSQNEHRQGVLQKHLARLNKRLAFLFSGIQKAAAVAAVAGAVLMSAGNVEAQAFAGSKGHLAGIDGLVSSSDINYIKLEDIDADGDLDAFTMNAGGSYDYFENTGTASLPVYASPVTNAFNFTPYASGLRVTFGDLDNDGDLDIIATGIGTNLGDFYYYENIGTASAPSFGARLTNPFGLTVNGSRPIAELVDIDGDGDLDLFSAGNNNYLVFFENTGTAFSPAFATSVNSPFGLPGIGQGLNPSFADMDNDGDLDIMAGFQYGDIYYMENTGTSTSPSFPSWVSVPFNITLAANGMGMDVVDYDNDGDLDILSGYNIGYNYQEECLFFENVGSASAPDFTFLDQRKSAPFGLEQVMGWSTLGDLDNDGDLDILDIKNVGIRYFENTGTPTIPDYANPVGFAFGIDHEDYAIPTLVDIDADGDLDLFTGGGYDSDSIFFYENTGSVSAPVFAAGQSSPFNIAVVPGMYTYASVSFADLDNDGDLDLLTATNFAKDFYYYENTGSSTSPSFATPIVNPLGLSAPATASPYSYMNAQFIDLDGDGDFDIMTGSSDLDFNYYENTGTASAPAFAPSVTNPFGISKEMLLGATFPVFGDMDNDGDMDMLSMDGIAHYYENIGSAQAILVSSIAAQGQGGVSTITTSGGSLQIEATVLPANATDGSYAWTVAAGTGSANIDANGLLTALSNGTVTVTATANDASGITGSTVITISNQGVGIDGNAVFSTVTLYPNPTTGNVAFKTNEEIKSIEVYNLTGKKVVEFENTNVIDISNLPKGVYMAKVITEIGSPVVRKLIKK